MAPARETRSGSIEQIMPAGEELPAVTLQRRGSLVVAVPLMEPPVLRAAEVDEAITELRRRGGISLIGGGRRAATSATPR